jgi:glycosyltransferase involved in cell wall biosynthesis
MAKRKSLTLIYIQYGHWVGGTYYVENIIKALMLLEEAEMPRLTILYNSPEEITRLKQIGYPHSQYVQFEHKLNFFKKVVNWFSKSIIHEPIFRIALPDQYTNYYPLNTGYQVGSKSNGYYWIPDLQEKYLPQYFSTKELKMRDRSLKKLISRNELIVFSSNSSLEDFKKFYPDSKNKSKVIEFVSINKTPSVGKSELTEKYNIRGDYFICPNQMWRHKNHLVVLKALKKLRDKNYLKDINIVFTGKEEDYRNPTHPESLKKYVDSNRLNDYVKFLGFIDREDQLGLLCNAQAVLQPSLFEGWSTVVEDAKSMNKIVVASDIDIHKEQLTSNYYFFSRNDETELANILIELNGKVPNVADNNYRQRIAEFAEKVANLFD